jgi:hypothetical protein
VVLIGEAAARGRERAESLMTDECRLFRRGAAVWDPVAGVDTFPETALYTGRCRVRPSGTQASGQESSGSELAVFPFTVSVPLSVTDVGLGDLVEVTGSSDGRLVGRVLRVEGVESGTHITARRLGCGEESR